MPTKLYIMESPTIKNHADLIKRIEELKIQKRNQEVEITETTKQMISSINIFSFFKKSKSSFQSLDILRNGITFTMDLIIDKIHGRNRNLKGYLGTILIEKAMNYFINNNLDSVISYVMNFFNNKNKSSNEETDFNREDGMPEYAKSDTNYQI